MDNEQHVCALLGNMANTFCQRKFSPRQMCSVCAGQSLEEALLTTHRPTKQLVGLGSRQRGWFPALIPLVHRQLNAQVHTDTDFQVELLKRNMLIQALWHTAVITTLRRLTRLLYYTKSKGMRWVENICKAYRKYKVPSDTKQHQHLKCEERMKVTMVVS
jgi:hypothetical protein